MFIKSHCQILSWRAGYRHRSHLLSDTQWLLIYQDEVRHLLPTFSLSISEQDCTWPSSPKSDFRFSLTWEEYNCQTLLLPGFFLTVLHLLILSWDDLNLRKCHLSSSIPSLPVYLPCHCCTLGCVVTGQMQKSRFSWHKLGQQGMKEVATSILEWL